jgi:DNA modification methylase
MAKDSEPSDDAPPVPEAPTTKPGDLYRLGDHRLLCGDSTNAEHVERLIGSEALDFIFSSPPYNVDVPYDNHDDNRVTWERYGGFLRDVLSRWLPSLGQGRALGWNIGVSPATFPGHQHVLLEELGLTMHRQIVWDKLRQGMPQFHHTERNPVARNWVPDGSHELVLVFSKGKLEHGGPIVIDELARYSVLPLAPTTATRDLPDGHHSSGGANRGLNRSYEKAHPAVFPVRLPEVFIGHLTSSGETIADPFMGAGTTLMACEHLGRRAVGMELDPGYCDVIVRRWEEYTGAKAERVSDGAAVEAVA